MVMIIAIIYILFVIFDQWLKITFRKSSGPPEKIHSPTHSLPKNSKIASPPFLPTLKIFWSSISLRGISLSGHF